MAQLKGREEESLVTRAEKMFMAPLFCEANLYIFIRDGLEIIVI